MNIGKAGSRRRATAARHSDQHFDAQLQEVKDRLLAMGARCEQLIAQALEAVEAGDPALAEAVEEADRRINADELALDDLAVRILATRAPVGRDLRLLVTTLKVVVDLERIGDEAVNVAERAGLLGVEVEGLREPRALLPEMGRRGAEMLRLALDSLVAENADGAARVLAMDDEVDALYERVLAAATDFMAAHPEQAELALGVASAGKYLERIADLCTNISEMVVYMVQGVDVRHGSFRRRSRRD